MKKQQIQDLFLCLLLSTAIIGCGESKPEATETKPSNQLENQESPVTSQDNSNFTETPPSEQPTPTKIQPQSPTEDKVTWKVIQGKEVSLSLPESYEGGKPDTDLNKIIDQLKGIDPEYAEKIENIQQNPTEIALLAFDLQQAKSSGAIASVNVSQQEMPPEVTVDQFLKDAQEAISFAHQVLEQEVVSIADYQAARIVAEATTGEQPTKLLFYGVQNGNTFWLVTYSTTPAEFDQQLPNFEKSIRSIAFPF